MEYEVLTKRENIFIIILDMYIKKTVQRNKNGKRKSLSSTC